MFSIVEIKSAHSKVKSGADFPAYIQDIKALGVTGYDTWVTDGHSDFRGDNGFTISSPTKYDALTIANTSNAAQFIADLKEHQQGKTSYLTFCEIAAKLGVEKWVISIEEMTCTYYDIEGKVLLEEKIPG